MDAELDVKIDDLARGGAGVGRAPDGSVVFVPFGVPGDVLRVKLTKRKKNYSEAVLLKILEASPDRVTPPCEVFGHCGGCQWQMIPYPLQWQTKFRGVGEVLKRVGIDFPLEQLAQAPAELVWEYRNRVQLRGSGAELGFFRGRTRELVPITRCEIARPEINARLDAIRETGARFSKYPVISGTQSTAQPIIRPAGPRVSEHYKIEVAVGADGRVQENWNSPHSADGFRQVHDAQNEKLKAWVAAALGSGDVLYDLFGGSGNFSLPLVDQMKRIECVDLSVPAIRPLDIPAHFRFHRAPVLSWLQNRNATGNQNLAIIDPPRAGLGNDLEEIAENLERMGVKTVVAIGCDTDAWAKDLSGWIQRGWTLKKGLVIDLFPQTIHIECVALLGL